MEVPTSSGSPAEGLGEEKPREAEPKDAGSESSEAPPDLAQLLRDRDETILALREQILRMQADFENYKRRQQNSLEDVKFLARESIIGNLLPLLDNFERASQALGTTQNVKAMAEGLQLILRQMKEILGREGLTEIQAEGQLFDPSLHEAVMLEDRDDVEDQTILATLQKGYRLGSRVLRPTLVKVACGSCPPNNKEESSNA
jgi:molecular chaperone GrpE